MPTQQVLPDFSVTSQKCKPNPPETPPGLQVLFCPHTSAETLPIPATFEHSDENCDINDPGNRQTEQQGKWEW